MFNTMLKVECERLAQRSCNVRLFLGYENQQQRLQNRNVISVSI